MRGHEFVDVFGEQQVTHLGSRIDPINLLSGERVEESDGSIGCASTRGK